MHDPPRRLPPLQTLRAFEAAARHGSFTLAARELSLTQGAVSRQIQNLEHRLGVALFLRRDRGVLLTAAGRRYRQAVSEALDGIARATSEIAVGEEGGPITLGTTSALASLWLLPRLTTFRRHEPELDIRVLVSDRGFEHDSGDVDLAIEYSRAGRDGDDVHPLFEEIVFPVCSPDYLDGRTRPARPGDLLQETLLDLEDDHPDWLGWTEWFRIAGVAGAQFRRPVRINSYTMVLQAAVAGQGVALGWSRFVDGYLDAGTLVPVMHRPRVGLGHFYLRLTHPVPSDTPIARLRDWLVGSATQEPAGH